MKLYIISDFHLEFSSFTPPDVEADVVVLAGDVDVGTRGITWISETFGDTPVIYVLGNHEYYGHTFPDLCDEMKEKCEGTNISLLENSSVQIGDIEFLGCSLWTDFEFNQNSARDQVVAANSMADFSHIRFAAEQRLLTPADTVEYHKKSLAFLEDTLEEETSLKRVVVTHHGPSAKSMHRRYQGSALNSAFYSRLDTLVERSGAKLWIHGHTHDACRYFLGETEVICNPRGYPQEFGYNHCDVGLVVEVSVNSCK